MSGILKTFTTTLQSNHLKGQGFQKRYETFSRQHPEFSEHYHIQPASWNRAGDKWTFHLIIGIGFNSIPSRQKGQLAGCHASKRHTTIETTLINPGESDPEKFRQEAARVADIILARSDYFQSRYKILRHSYDRGILRQGFPADPEFDAPET
jgi:hypothetical protein